MSRKRTRFSLDNARIHPTGQDVESAARVALLARGVSPHRAERAAAFLRACFERSGLETDDPNDRAHAKIDGVGVAGFGGWLIPGAAVDSARPRRYPRACLVEVVEVVQGRRAGKTVRISIDSDCEQLGDRAARLAAQGVPVGYVGSVTGAQQQRARGPKDVDLAAFAAQTASARGKSLRDITRHRTRQELTPEERALEAAGTRLIEANGWIPSVMRPRRTP